MVVARADSKRRLVIPGVKPGDVFDVQRRGDDQHLLVRLRPVETSSPKSQEECLEAMSQAPLHSTLSWDQLRRLTR